MEIKGGGDGRTDRQNRAFLYPPSSHSQTLNVTILKSTFVATKYIALIECIVFDSIKAKFNIIGSHII